VHTKLKVDEMTSEASLNQVSLSTFNSLEAMQNIVSGKSYGIKNIKRNFLRTKHEQFSTECTKIYTFMQICLCHIIVHPSAQDSVSEAYTD
jgi:hypothetical protein